MEACQGRNGGAAWPGVPVAAIGCRRLAGGRCWGWRGSNGPTCATKLVCDEVGPRLEMWSVLWVAALEGENSLVVSRISMDSTRYGSAASRHATSLLIVVGVSLRRSSAMLRLGYKYGRPVWAQCPVQPVSCRAEPSGRPCAAAIFVTVTVTCNSQSVSQFIISLPLLEGYGGHSGV